MADKKLKVFFPHGVFKVRIGRKGIHAGLTVSVSTHGNLKPCEEGDHPLGVAKTFLRARKVAEYYSEAGEFYYPSKSSYLMDRLLKAYWTPGEYVSEKIFPKFKP